MSKLVAHARAALEKRQFHPALEAIAQCEQAGPLALQHYMIRGLAQLGLSDWKAAIDTFRAATERWRDNHEFWAYRGLTVQNIKGPENTQEAVDCFERSLNLNPNNGIAAANLANLYRLMGRFKEAEVLAQTGAKYHPDKIWAMNMLALVTGELGHYEKARDIYYEILKRDPNAANAIYNLANMETNLENFAAAWPLYARAQELDPHPRMRTGEALAHLLAQNYAKGWALYEARCEMPDGGLLMNKPPGKLYAGEPLTGKKILLVAEQGFGDMIQFCRFGAKLIEKGAEIAWIVQKPLARLFAHNLPGQVYAPGDAVPDFDYHMPICSLPHFVEGGASPDQWPMPPYLKAPDGPTLPPAGREGLKIGIIWAGAPKNDRDHHRSMHLQALAPLFREVKAQFYAPFLSDKLGQIKDEPIMRLDHLIKDFGDTAALMQQMDTIITVETSAAHLAGALGKKTFILLSGLPDWRWGYRGEHSPWYPGTTLLRQDSLGDWASTIQKLVTRLEHFPIR